MAHKTITVSEDAYHLLKVEKKGHESFTDVIIRVLGQKRNKAELLEWLSQLKDATDFADAVEVGYQRREGVSLRY